MRDQRFTFLHPEVPTKFPRDVHWAIRIQSFSTFQNKPKSSSSPNPYPCQLHFGANRPTIRCKHTSIRALSRQTTQTLRTAWPSIWRHQVHPKRRKPATRRHIPGGLNPPQQPRCEILKSRINKICLLRHGMLNKILALQTHCYFILSPLLIRIEIRRLPSCFFAFFNFLEQVGLSYQKCPMEEWDEDCADDWATGGKQMTG